MSLKEDELRSDAKMSDTQTFELARGINIADLGLYLSDYNTLVISDLHIGYEEALRKQGVLIPKFHFRDLVDRLERIFDILKSEEQDVETIIINGDLKHEFGKISDEEWRNTIKILDWFSRKAEKIVIVKGNHDKIIGPIAEKKKVSIVDSVILGDMMIIHGDQEAEIPPPVKTLIIGHDHPAIGITDNLRTETFKCFLKGQYKTKMKTVTLIVQPSMNPVVEGTDVLRERPLSPYLRQHYSTKKMTRFDAYVVGDEIYHFGKLKKLYK